MKFILFLIAPLFLLATSSFITPLEYSSQLYKNPRGIGCQLCHGNNGEGKLIANYVHKNKKKSFRGPEIDKISFGDFYKALKIQKDGMPRYYLTQKEIEALYLYLHHNDKKVHKDVK
jgi:mono/diheme cytochrome c family protein